MNSTQLENILDALNEAFGDGELSAEEITTTISQIVAITTTLVSIRDQVDANTTSTAVAQTGVDTLITEVDTLQTF